MGLNLILKRKPFAVIQVLCDAYEDRFKEKVATASMINVLIAEALAARGLIPKDYVLTEYGATDPIKEGFTASARKESAIKVNPKQLQEIESMTRYFDAIVMTEWEIHPSQTWRNNVLETAKKWPQISSARLILELNNKVVAK